MNWKKWMTAALVLTLTGGAVVVTASAEQGEAARPAGPLKRAYWRALGIKTAPLSIRVVDAATMKGIPGAGCVVGETGDRVETDEKGTAKTIEAPIFRHQRLEEMLAQLHGQLTLLCYKNGYRDSIYMGVRMHEGVLTEAEVWMYPFGPQDRRIEPTLYQVPIHRVWQIELADKYRLKEEGEGPERPELNRPDVAPAPQSEIGGGVQTPTRQAPPPPVVPPAAD